MRDFRKASAVLLVTLTFIALSSRQVRGNYHDSVAQQPAIPDDCSNKAEFPPPLLSKMPPGSKADFEKRVYDFLNTGSYLGWCRDKGVRDTGPYINNTYYGTHPAVRIFYSPNVVEWLKHGRKDPLPDGAMIVKEQYTPPSARYLDMNETELAAAFAKSKDWTVMIKDSAGAKDGWFWGEFYAGMTFDGGSTALAYPNAGFGQYCLRCHASAEKESTFSSLDNLKAFPGDPLTFFVDDSWRKLSPLEKPALYTHPSHRLTAFTRAPSGPNPEFLKYFPSIGPVPVNKVEVMPAETLDRVVAGPKGAEQFISSDQCMMCHSAATGPYGPIMFLQTAPPVNGVPSGINVSPYGEWRWSPMGLAGRDPIFFAQLESEIAILKSEFKEPDTAIRATVNTCLTCHGGMGKRQFDIDHKDPWANFQLDYLKITDPADPNFKYGSLARDGISCALCHHATEAANSSIADFLENSTTGQFLLNKPDEVYGPFKDDTISILPMDNALGIKPKHSDFTTSSRLCGTCHTINLPNIDDPLKPGEKPTVLDRAEKNPVFKPFKHSLEQATYMEWLNSSFQTDFGPTATAKSCQDCHMPGSYENAVNRINIPQLQQLIAVIEDGSYPAADNRTDQRQIRVRFREEGFVRHELLGLNAYLMEMFNQFNTLLGVRKDDYMSGSKTGLQNAIANVVEQAKSETATVEVLSKKIEGNKLTTTVRVTNLTGHRFPSGVGFRRAFLEFNVKDATKDIWTSGRTNNVGIILGANGQPLPSEFYEEYRDGQQLKQHYQPHYETITSQDQVQIYEELVTDSKGKISTSFIHRDTEIKDNRLLPKGWTPAGPSPKIPEEYIKETFPKGNALQDPNYSDGSGTDVITYEVILPEGTNPANVSVTATLFYQAIPPPYLNMRFREADGPATKRLYYLASNLSVSRTAIDSWKLKVASVTVK
ncbi:MAG TPA: cytochrome P460 family protein [Pyrinomonadaceae bacterium]